PAGGLPRRGRLLSGTLIPRRSSASRSSISISALAERSSFAARRSIASCTAGSRRSGKALRGGGLAGESGMGLPEGALSLLIGRACVDHRLGVAFAAQHHHQVRDHGDAALVIELDN